MIVLGALLVILGLVLHVDFLGTVGVILLAIGAVLWIFGALGRPVAGRRYWY